MNGSWAKIRQKSFWSNVKRVIISDYSLLLLCLSAAAFFIFANIDLRSFWIDEAFVANILSENFSSFLGRAFVEGQPYSYTLAIKLWSILFGISELSLRTFSAIFALALIVLLYKSGKLLFNSRKIGLLAAAFASTSYLLIWFSDQARPYVLASFIGLASYYFFVKTISNPKVPNIILYALFAILTVYSHPWSSMVFAAEVVATVIYRKSIPRVARFVYAEIIVFLSTIPNSLMMLDQARLHSTSWIGKVGAGALWQSLKFIVYGNAWIIIVAAIIALAYTLYRNENLRLAYDPEYKKLAYESQSTNNSQEKMSLVILGLYLLFPTVVGWLVSQFLPIYVVGRYEMFVLPACLLLLAFWLSKIESNIILVLICLLMGFNTWRTTQIDRRVVLGYESTDRSVASDIFKRLNNGDYVITTDLSWATFDYYLNSSDNHLQKNFTMTSFPAELVKHPGWKNEKTMLLNQKQYEVEAGRLIQTIKSRIGTDSRIWLIYQSNNQTNEIIFNQLSRDFRLASRQVPPLNREPSWFNQIIVFEP